MSSAADQVAGFTKWFDYSNVRRRLTLHLPGKLQEITDDKSEPGIII
jgi:hypothetical protein